ncbi:MAG: hypothetical protein ACREHG_08570, partial [Candidatus Saccharimonadales bacterium]
MTKTPTHKPMRLSWLYISAAVALLIVGLTYGTGVFDKLQTGGFNDPKAASTMEQTEESANFRAANPALIVLFEDSNYKVADPAYAAKVQSVVSQIQKTRGVNSIL